MAPSKTALRPRAPSGNRGLFFFWLALSLRVLGCQPIRRADAMPAEGGIRMKTAAYGLSFISVAIAIMYYMLPGGSLPTFFPGYVARSTHIHFMHGVAATAGAVVFLLVGLSTRRR
jgi:hypothetical protein